MEAPGTVLPTSAFNLRDPILKDVRVRQAIAYAIDAHPMIHYLCAMRRGPPAAFFRRSTGPTTAMCARIRTIPSGRGSSR